MLKEFIKKILKMNIIKKIVKHVELNTKVTTAFLNTQLL